MKKINYLFLSLAAGLMIHAKAMKKLQPNPGNSRRFMTKL